MGCSDKELEETASVQRLSRSGNLNNKVRGELLTGQWKGEMPPFPVYHTWPRTASLLHSPSMFLMGKLALIRSSLSLLRVKMHGNLVAVGIQ